ncbi:MAG TPA: ABC transporter ATP-binding protein [Acidimicrobiales bacterium]|nr:ABC transporter ATP-binding protein [Acidimicrobiales bacterium]
MTTATVEDGPLRPGALLRVEDVVVEFPAPGGRVVHAVSGVSFDVLEGETLGLVGESGSGKTSIGRAVMQLPPPRSGRVLLDGVDLTTLGRRQVRAVRPRLQMVFQDPLSSLNPRRSVRGVVGEPMRVWNRSRPDIDARVDELLSAVGLDPAAVGDRRPSQFSGGQCQRISIARALVLEPQVLVCDEAVSSLDVSVRAQILNLLLDLRERYRLTMLFIAHDLSVVRHISDRVAVMYLGKLCEIGPAASVFGGPAHPYTAALLESVPVPDPSVRPSDEEVLDGEPPSPVDPPSGCRFRTRCPRAQPRCAEEEPIMRAVAPEQFVACHFPLTAGAPRP